ncbi:MAG: glycosyltransferase [Chloroflexi bacterium]|nr:glycosyltransferase [Chloroflexota bacterium]
MNVLHVTPYYAPAWAFGGVARAVTDLAVAQVERGDVVRVLTTDIADLRGGRIATLDEMRDGVHVQRAPNLLPSLRARYNLSTPIGFTKLLRAALPQAQVVHLHEFRSLEALLTVRAKPSAPIVLSLQGTLPVETGRSAAKRLWDRLFGRYTARHIAGVAAVTEIERAQVEAYWRRLKLPVPLVRVIPNAVGEDIWAGLAHPQLGEDIAALRRRFGIGNVPIVLFLGRLHERKGLQYLIPAFGEALRSGADAHLLIAGADAGMLREVERLIAAQQLGERVTVAGLLTGRERIAALAAAEIFALPAVGEGLALAALEAAASGCALLLTEGCNMPEAAAHGAALIAERNVGALSRALQQLLESPNLRHSMGAAAQRWAENTFRWKKVAEQVAQLYAECITLKGQ